jgi:hypothetical protein
MPPKALFHPCQAVTQPRDLRPLRDQHLLLLDDQLLQRAECDTPGRHQRANRLWRPQPVSTSDTGRGRAPVGQAEYPTLFDPPAATLDALNAYAATVGGHARQATSLLAYSRPELVVKLRAA